MIAWQPRGSQISISWGLLRAVQVIMEKEAQNPEFVFLYNLASPEHAYYRWRLFSLSQGAPPQTMVDIHTQRLAKPHMSSIAPRILSLW